MDTNRHLDSFEVFPWNPDFETGIREVDDQHKRIVELINELTNMLVSENTAETRRLFEAMANYAGYHFETEELTWAPYFGDDPWFQAHQKAHRDFLPEILALQEEQGDRPRSEVVEEIIRFLIRWLSSHIIENDKRMAVVISLVKDGMELDQAKVRATEIMSGSSGVLINALMNMYERLITRTIDLMRERNQRMVAENKLRSTRDQLQDLASRDQLTGLANRRSFEEVFDRELRRARREKRPLSLIMADIDFFKRLNDRYGHMAGDDALARVGQELEDTCRRPGDFAFRIGGEEFVVLVADQAADGAVQLAELIRQRV